jgi:hypothetical protein
MVGVFFSLVLLHLLNLFSAMRHLTMDEIVQQKKKKLFSCRSFIPSLGRSLDTDCFVCANSAKYPKTTQPDRVMIYGEKLTVVKKKNLLSFFRHSLTVHTQEVRAIILIA